MCSTKWYFVQLFCCFLNNDAIFSIKIRCKTFVFSVRFNLTPIYKNIWNYDHAMVNYERYIIKVALLGPSYKNVLPGSHYYRNADMTVKSNDYAAFPGNISLSLKIMSDRIQRHNWVFYTCFTNGVLIKRFMSLYKGNDCNEFIKAIHWDSMVCVMYIIKVHCTRTNTNCLFDFTLFHQILGEIQISNIFPYDGRHINTSLRSRSRIRR